MKEKMVKEFIKQGVKSPSSSFADDLMIKISSQKEIATNSNWKLLFLFLSCFLTFALSLFLEFPNIKYLNYSIKVSPLIIPILSISFILIVFYQLYEIREKIHALTKNNVVQH